MAHLTTPAIVRQLGSLFEAGSAAALSDRQLIERFVARRDDRAEDAFAALVARHGPMVLGVCRQIVADYHLAEDAFQATFLVLARKAPSLRDPDLLGTWLYGVALRTARKARARIIRQHQHEQANIIDEPTSPPAEQAFLDREQAEVLHGEIDRLPESFRSPVVLCYFEGLTLDEAARRLRCPAGTLRSRLARAREKLRRALNRRGATLASISAPPSVSPHLCDLTARAALRFAARPAMTSTATTLAHEVLRAMTIHKLRTALATLVFLAALGSGGGYLAWSLARGDEPRKAPDVVPAPAAEKPAPGRMFVVGRVLDPDGKPKPGATVMVYAATKQPGRGDSWDKRSPSAIGQARSDDSGRFRVDAERTTSARHHRFGAVAIAPGYGAGWVELDPDADRPAADIALRPEQVIEGRLFDVNGRPVRDIEVTVQAMGRVVPGIFVNGTPARVDSLEGPSFLPMHRVDLPAWPRPAFSDAEGRFTVRGIGRGLHVVLGIDDPRFARAAVPVDTDAASRSKSLTAALEPARIIAGRVTDAETDRPIPHARIIVLSYKGSAGYVNPFEADDQGRFRMNPLSADRYSISVSSTSGQPYLGTSTATFDWPRGAVEHRVDLPLRRGALIRGKVVEEGSGRPVAGARISFGTRRKDEPNGASSGHAESGQDGSFQFAALPAAGYLIVLAPTDDYVLQTIGDRMVREGRPGGRRFYAHAFIPLDPKPDRESPEIAVPLRRGVTVKGRVVGPNGRLMPETAMIGRVFLLPQPGAWQFWRYDPGCRVRDGRFEVHGLDPDAEVPIHFLEPTGKLGATVKLSGKSGAGGPVTVRLESCGTARARLVDPVGKPDAGTLFRRISMIVTPGAHQSGPEPPAEVLADESVLLQIDPLHYGNGPLSDAEGRIAFPALIPGATYSVSAGPRGGPPTFRKEFTVKPGETLDLGDIPIEKPPG